MNGFTFTRDPIKIKVFASVVFIFSVATISHLLFSHLGHNPTDDGWILAGSRRIIEGQIPHRDFLFHSPAGSFFLHAPFVLFGGDYTYLISRYFVWIQFAAIAWIWTVVIARSFNVFHTVLEKFAVALIAFSFSANHFPIMAWYTTDGIFFVSIGILLCDNESRWTKTVGYIFIGVAPVCKQVFLPMIPIAVILFNDWRRLSSWISASIPIVLYGTYLAIYGAIPDAIIQLTTHTNFYYVCVFPYVVHLSFPWGIIIGVLAAAYSTFDFKHLTNANIFQRLLGFLLLFGIILSAAFALLKGSDLGYVEIMAAGLVAYLLYSTFNFKRLINTNVFHRLFGFLLFFGIIFSAVWILANWSIFGYYPGFQLEISYSIFGAVIGVIIYCIVRKLKLTSFLRYGALAVCVGLFASFAFGRSSPFLLTGPLSLFLIAFVQFSSRLANGDRVSITSKNLLIRWISSPRNLHKIINILVILSAVSSLVAFGMARQRYIFRDLHASHLTYDLGDVMPGAKGIKTNKNTYEFYRDLQNAKKIVEEKGKKYCIIPDMAANWAKDPQSNPLPTDSTRFADSRGSEYQKRIVEALEENRGTTIIILQKYDARYVYKGFIPVAGTNSVNYVRSNFDKIGETQYFELYE